MSSSASRLWMTTGRFVIRRNLQLPGKNIALHLSVGVIVVVIQADLPNRDDARV